ncbi:hypothetical protein D3C76_1316230 [compost metagenome]
MIAAGRAIFFFRCFDAYFLVFIAPYVKAQQPAAQLLTPAAQQLERLCGCIGSHKLNRLRQNTCGIAGISAKRNGSQQAIQTRRLSRENRIGYPVAAHTGPVYPGNAVFLGYIVDNQAGIKIISPVHNQIHPGQQALQLFRTHIHDVGFDHNL